MNRKLFCRVVSCILAFVFFLEPVSVHMLEAAELPKPKVNTEDVGLMDPEEIMAPHDYLDFMLDMRGRTKKDVEMRAWSEWQGLINSSYLMLDEGADDVFGLYDALSIAKTVKTTTTSVGSTIGNVWKYAHMTTTFLSKIGKKNRSGTALNCWARMNKRTEKAVDLCKNSKTLNFLSFCCPPSSWHNAKDVSKGMDQYYHWLKRDNQTALTNAQGVSRSIGIGFAIIGTALAAWKYFGKNIDRKVGRWSYNRVKDLVALGFAAAGIVAMFCIPIVGQVLAIITAIWGVLTMIGDMIGEFNKKWKEAYKNSYWFLYQNDPEFKSYYDNRDSLTDDEKSACLYLMQQKYSDYLATDTAGLDEDEKEVAEKNQRIYTSLEKQGVVTSYYNRKPYKSTFSNTELLELWKMKASYMAWKPTEEESNQKKSFWQKVGAVFNPKTYISWAADKIGSSKFNRYTKENNIDRVYFNPDYVLVKKYQHWLTANKKIVSEKNNPENDNSFYRMIGLRLEQSPFNYIPLVGIDVSMWNKELLEEAFLADAFIVGQKEMMAIQGVVKNSAEGLKDSIKESDKLVKSISKEQLPKVKKIREFLDLFAELYSDEDTRVKESKKLYNLAVDAFDDFVWSKSYKKTPEMLLIALHDDIEKALYYEPLVLSQNAAEMVLLTITIKGNLDMGTLMSAYVEDKWDMMKSFDKDFTTSDIKKYLKEGSFLNIKGGGFLDWLAEIYPVYDECDKTLKLMEKDVKNYNKEAGLSASDKRSFLLIFKRSVDTPPELVEKMNEELEAWKETISAWDKIKSDANVKVILAENVDFADKVLAPYDVSEFKLESLDPDDDFGFNESEEDPDEYDPNLPFLEAAAETAEAE